VWCVFTIGWWGTLMLLLFTVGAFLIFNFNHHVEAAWVRFSEWWADMLKPNPKDEEEEEPKTIPNERILPSPQLSFIKLGSKIIPRNVRNSRRRN
jgi:hypothetical protein